MNKSIAIIEDSELISDLYHKFMENTFSCDVKTFSSAEEFLNSDMSPDLILLDYFLDKGDPSAMTGLDLLDELRHSNREMPVIVVSGLRNHHVMKQLRDYKIINFIDKDAPQFWIQLENGIRDFFNNK
ncbi:MAG: response regulator [Flavobacteriales bacterium]